MFIYGRLNRTGINLLRWSLRVDNGPTNKGRRWFASYYVDCRTCPLKFLRFVHDSILNVVFRIALL
jgi:hypothetical protein